MPKTQKQMLDDNCGQTCVAMLAGISQYGAVFAVGNDHGTSPSSLHKSLEKFGFIVERKRFSEKEMETGKGIALLRSTINPDYGHAVVYREGNVEDPALGIPIRVDSFIRTMDASNRRVTGLIAITGRRV